MYETGILVALALWLYSTVSMFVRKNSLMEKNLNRIGRQISTTGLGVSDMKYPKPTAGKIFAKQALISALGLPFVLLSWLYVLVVGGMMVHAFIKDLGVPQSIKEWRWKLKNLDMTFDEMIKEIVKQEGLDESEYPRVRQEWVDYIDGLKARQ
uniref:hypothetical protein n=1 Tax=Psychrobacter sp. TaxID=56811 RepID=UPI001598F347|nr:hypothetical protein [Psychrobacter sp.]QJS05820.1 hypothetical protein [Psychrobacter sp.]